MAQSPPSDEGETLGGGAAAQRSVTEEVASRAAALIAGGQTSAAAAVFAAHGDHARASKLLEEACDFAGAAREALAAGDPRRAIHLGALGGEEALCAEAIKALVTSAPRSIGLRAASDLSARGLPRYAGTLFEELGEHLSAAHAFTAADDARRAAACFERANRPADGARALEAALRRRPDDDGVRLDLGRLLAKHGRTEAAVRALQQLAPTSLERQAALPLLARCLTELGFEDGAKRAREEMAELGIDGRSESPPGSGRSDQPKSGEARQTGGVLLFGRYESVREVASTPHARVIEAQDRVTGERVAVKIFAGGGGEAGRDALLRFEREARALAQLRHPNVVPLRAYLPEGPAMVLAWMGGGSLAERTREEPMAPGRAAEIAIALLSALGEAHRLGILHRDVKPTNVLFDEAGTAHLSDFGAAHLGDLASTATAGAIGTFAYMSPEQRLGRPASMASDLYGVGAVLYEMLAGEPAKSASAGRLDRPPSAQNPDLTPAHDAVVAHLLEEEARDRPSDAFEARRAIQALAWPDRAPRRTATLAPRQSERPLASPSHERLAPARDASDGRDGPTRRHDAWIGRDVIVLPLDDATLARARAFARAGHPALPTVLRVDTDERQIWVAAPQGRALADEPRALSTGQRARLRDAIEALHAAGGAHGSIDRAHLYWYDGEVTLSYPCADASAEGAAELDLRALAELD